MAELGSSDRVAGPRDGDLLHLQRKEQQGAEAAPVIARLMLIQEIEASKLDASIFAVWNRPYRACGGEVGGVGWLAAAGSGTAGLLVGSVDGGA